MSATKTTATENEVKTIETPAPSIPAARLPDEAAPPKKNLKDRMKGMKAAPVEKKATDEKKPTYDAPPEAVDALRRFIPADTIRAIAEKRAENAKDEASEIMFKAFCTSLWKNKAVPSNPKVVVRDEQGQPDMSAIFIVQDRFTPNNMKLPEIKVDMEEEDVVAKIVATLVEAGVEKDDAEKLVANEIETSKRRNIRSLNELALGHMNKEKQWVDATAKEQAVAEKLMDFLDTLDPQEQEIIRRDEMKVTVKPQFLTKVCQYAHAGEQVAAILRIFGPVNFVSHAAIGLSDDEATKILKLQQAANEIIGSVQVK